MLPAAIGYIDVVVRVMIVFNPVSGMGRAAEAGQALALALKLGGHDTLCVPTRPEPGREWLDESMQVVELVVVAGGDGAVRMIAPVAARLKIPLYHFPCGTENLFAREFGMNREPATLLKAMDQREVRRMDIAHANRRTFLLMASVGFDAEVVHDLASTRGKSISHMTYVRPVFRQFCRWRPPRLMITVDGRRIDNDQPGFVVVGNSRQYGWRINPAGRAVVDDGLLDVVFFPTNSRAGLMRWVLLSRLQRHLRNSRLVYLRGREIEITALKPHHYQLDGDPPEAVADEQPRPSGVPWRLRIGLRPESLLVLVPPGSELPR